MELKKNMKPGNKIYLISILILYLLQTGFSSAEEKIISTPLINVDEIKPSFEEPSEENENVSLINNSFNVELTVSI